MATRGAQNGWRGPERSIPPGNWVLQTNIIVSRPPEQQGLHCRRLCQNNGRNIGHYVIARRPTAAPPLMPFLIKFLSTLSIYYSYLNFLMMRCKCKCFECFESLLSYIILSRIIPLHCPLTNTHHQEVHSWLIDVLLVLTTNTVFSIATIMLGGKMAMFNDLCMVVFFTQLNSYFTNFFMLSFSNLSPWSTLWILANILSLYITLLSTTF